MPVDIDRQDQIGIITFRREEKRNAIDAEMTTAIDEALNAFEEDDALRVCVLTGGRRVFCAGTDLGGGSGLGTERGGEYGIIRRRCNKPLIAAIEGIAFGGGLEIALCCDMIVAASDARLGLPEVSRGVVATSAGLFRAPRSLPLNVARELLLTGDPIDADRAERVGLVNRVTEPGGALAGAIELAKRVARNSPVSIRETLRAIDATVSADDALGWEATDTALEAVQSGEDIGEGIRAFFEKREPNWPKR